ncbi:MAG: hypothetical protein A2014_03845 [Spirochaetes bacterium GWF1_49_6]|nr:MAG: hypothetical protein A2014_03845 [Spirochaetes bacterium GWF1_49_6]
MMRNKTDVPVSLKEIWEIKERIYNETKSMSIKEFYKYVDENTRELKKELKEKLLKTGIK